MRAPTWKVSTKGPLELTVYAAHTAAWGDAAMYSAVLYSATVP